MTVSAVEAAALRRLVARVPVLEPILAEHLEDNFGEMLPHLLLADVARYVVDAARGDEEGRRSARRVVDELEAEFARGDHQVRELIAVSFLENLPREGDAASTVAALMGPQLEAEARELFYRD